MSEGSWILNSQSVIANAFEVLNRIDPGDGLVMSIAKEKSKRSKAQHRLKWLWMQQIARERAGNEGFTYNQWNDYLKGRYMRDLLISQDEEYQAYFDTVEMMWHGLTPGQKSENRYGIVMAVGKALKTEDLTVKNMSEFMNRVDQFAIELGIQLITPAELSWVSER